MSLRRNNTPKAVEPQASDAMRKLFEEKASFAGAVGTTHDVDGISAIYRLQNCRTMLYTKSDKDSDWVKDLKKILTMFAEKKTSGMVEFVKTDAEGLLEINISIADGKFMLMNKSDTVAEGVFADVDKFIVNVVKFMEDMKMALKDVQLRVAS